MRDSEKAIDQWIGENKELTNKVNKRMGIKCRAVWIPKYHLYAFKCIFAKYL